jgi:hypothetical protein
VQAESRKHIKTPGQNGCKKESFNMHQDKIFKYNETYDRRLARQQRQK